MAEITVNTDIINSSAAADYFNKADRRVIIGVRTALEMLRIPLPDYAIKKPTGRPPAKAIAAAYRADNPSPKPVPIYKPHIPVPADVVAAAKARQAQRLGTSRPEDVSQPHTLFNDIFDN